MMLPSSSLKLHLSKMNMFGIGNRMMRRIMKRKGIDSLETLNELKITAAQTFKAAGGDRFSLVSPLNADPALAKMYESIVSDYVR